MLYGILYASDFSNIDFELLNGTFKLLYKPYVGVEKVIDSEKERADFLHGVYSDISGDSTTVRTEIFKCTECAKAFIGGTFLSCGSIIDPKSEYHIEFELETEEKADSIFEILNLISIESKKTYRKAKQKYYIYIKDSGVIEDILAYMGAQSSAFELMNVKIYRDLRNNANRHANCDTANIDKVVKASQKQIDAIVKIIDSGMLEFLPDDLRPTLDLRAANPNATLAELAEMHSPALTKSGVNHRLKRIIEFSEKR